MVKDIHTSRMSGIDVAAIRRLQKTMFVAQQTAASHSFHSLKDFTTMYRVNGETFNCYTVACMYASMNRLCVVEIGTGNTLWRPFR